MKTMDATFQLNLDSETVDRCDPVEPLCLTPSDTVEYAFRQMKDHNRGAVLVCDQQVVIGIFTERDALKLMAAGASFDVPLQKSMTANPVVLRARDTVGKAITLMRRAVTAVCRSWTTWVDRRECLRCRGSCTTWSNIFLPRFTIFRLYPTIRSSSAKAPRSDGLHDPLPALW